MLSLSLLFLISSIFFQHANASRFVSYLGQVGSGWGTPANNEEFLKVIGVPGYGGSKGYNILNFAFWISTSTNGGAAANGAAYEWQNILNRITSTSLRQTLTGSANPSAAALRSAIKSLYDTAGIKIFISAFGGNDHPMQNGKSASSVGSQLAAYANTYDYDGVDVDWEEAINGYFGAGASGEQWLCTLTNALRSSLASDKQISHAPQAPYFMGSTSNQYPNGGYATVHGSCGSSIDFYNVQFYNQGSTAYNTYNSLFVNAIGWSKNSGVYEIMNGASPENVKVPASKIVVGKHTKGDGSSFVSGSDLKSIFNSALSAGQWNAGFMTWQFYKEIYPSSGSTTLIDEVINANWNDDGGSTVVVTSSPATSSTSSSSSSCYAYPSMAINLNNAIDTLGSCGTGSGDYRCEDGNCCNGYGYCGTSSAYCGNPVADWRTTACTGTGTGTSSTQSAVVSTSKSTSSSSSDGGLEGIVITNAAGSGAWWYKATLSNIPSGITIASVQMMGVGQSAWVTGQYTSWGDFYLFNADIPSNGYTAPLSFKILSTSGNEIVAYNVMSTVSAGWSVALDGSATFEMEDDAADANEGEGNDGKMVIELVVMGLVIGFLMIGCIVFVVRKQMRKQYVSQSNDDDDDVALAQLAKNDGMKVMDETELIGDGNAETIEIDVEIDVNDHDKDAMMGTA